MLTFVKSLPWHRSLEPVERRKRENTQAACVGHYAKHEAVFEPLTDLQKASPLQIIRWCKICAAAHVFSVAEALLADKAERAAEELGL